MIGKYHGTDLMIDVIGDDYRMLQVISRFGITLGFGDQTVAETCKSAGVDLETFLTIVNYLKDIHAPINKLVIIVLFDGRGPCQDKLIVRELFHSLHHLGQVVPDFSAPTASQQGDDGLVRNIIPFAEL